MNGGRGRAGMIAGAGVVVLIGIALVWNFAPTPGYDAAASETARIRQDHFDGFFGCALAGMPPTELSAVRVQTAFQNVGDEHGKSYEQTLRACGSKLSALSTSVEALHVPDAAARQHESLVAAADTLVVVNAEYLRHLSRSGPADGHVSDTSILVRFGAAWAGYDVADTSLRLKLGARL